MADPRHDRVRSGLDSQVNGEFGAFGFRNGLHNGDARTWLRHPGMGNNVAVEAGFGGLGDGDFGGCLLYTSDAADE